MMPRLTAALDKCKISDRDFVHVLTAYLAATGLDLNDFVLSRSTLKRAREIFRKKSNDETFFDLNLDFTVVIHWD